MNESTPCTPFSGRTSSGADYRGHQDSCLIHPNYGSALVPKERWKQAQNAEARGQLKLFDPRKLGGQDAVATFMFHILNISQLPEQLPDGADVGRIAEIGCGSASFSNALLRARPDLRASVVSLIDPGMPGYIKAGMSTYANGTLQGRYPAELLPVGAELLPNCYTGAYDMVLLINMVEHGWNAFAVLHHAYRLLKPGGLFFFFERVVKLTAASQIFHPIRLTTQFYDDWLSANFDKIVHMHSPPYKSFLETEVRFVGRKKQVPSSLLIHGDGGLSHP